MTDTIFNQKMMSRKLEGHYDSTKVHNQKIVSYSIVETVLMIIIFFAQFLYIKKLVDQHI